MKPVILFIKDKIDKVVTLLIVVAVLSIIMIQAAHFTPYFNNIIMHNENFEGVQLLKDQYLYNRGFIILEVEGSPNESLKVLQNGEEISNFRDNIIYLEVKQHDVIELDGRFLYKQEKVKIKNKSKNIILKDYTDVMLINSGIKKIAQIEFVQ